MDDAHAPVPQGGETCSHANGLCSKTYTRHGVFGVTLWVDTCCNQAEVLEVMCQDLSALEVAAPASAWQRILASPVAVWVNETFTYRGAEGEAVEGRGSCLHVSPEWLRGHGNMPEKANSVEIYCWEHYKTWDLARVGNLAHELAHLYHGVVGWDNPDIRGAFESAMACGRYDSVPHCRGGRLRAYACTNDTEFFASLSVPYLGLRNDYYPFVLEDLEAFDPASLAMLDRVWRGGRPRRCAVFAARARSAQALGRCRAACGDGALALARGLLRAGPAPAAPPPAPLALGDEARRWCISPSGRFDCAVGAEACGRAPRVQPRHRALGTAWRVVAADPDGMPGYVRVYSERLGPASCLDLSNPGRAPVLRPRAHVSGQYWHAARAPGGAVRLSTSWLGQDHVLACDADARAGGLRMQAVGTAGSGVITSWTFHDWFSVTDGGNPVD